MADMTTTGGLVQKVCAVSIVAIFFVVGGGLQVGLASKASAQEVDMTTFCYHFHNWASSGTTGVEDVLCDHLDQIGDYPVYSEEFCFHVHRFAANRTSELVGSTEVLDWCNDEDEYESPITWEMLDSHYHNNAGTGTTRPVQ